MFRRLLSFFGLSWYVPNLSTGNSSDSSSPETDGDATVSFAPGQRAGFSASEAEEGQDQRRAEITDNDLVWPGKISEIGFPNDAEVDYRFELTVTDLEPAYYTIRPPQGGRWHQDGGVLLQPGEETKYEVLFQAPSEVKSRSRTFNIVISRFDPRRSNDPGEVVGELPTRWVAMPTAADFTLTNKIQEVVTRPWRRTALFAVELGNRSYLPPSLHMKILRAPKKEDLEKNTDAVEQIGTFGQDLESRRSGLFHFLAPALNPKGSYYATVKGTARVADKTEFAIGLAKPVHVRYVPWLRMGRDWLVLFGGLFLLLYIVWGIPVYKSPQVKLTVKFGGKNPALPEHAQWTNLKLSITPVLNGLSGQEIPVTLDQSECDFTLPGSWYGYRPLIGWHGVHDVKFRGVTKLGGPDQTKTFLNEYDIDDKPLQVSSDEHAISSDGGDITLDLSTLAKKLPVFGDWIVTGNVTIPSKTRVHVNISASGLGTTAQTVGIQLSGTLGSGNFDRMLVRLNLVGKQYVATNIPLNLPQCPPDLLNITATIPTNPNLSANWLSPTNVSYDSPKPYDVQLKFQALQGIAGPATGGTTSAGPATGGAGSAGHTSIGPSTGGTTSTGPVSTGPATTGPSSTGPKTGGLHPAQNPEQQLAVEMMKTFKNLVSVVVSNQPDTVKDSAATSAMKAAQAVVSLNSGDVWHDRALAIVGYGYLQKKAIAPDAQKSDLASKASAVIDPTYDNEKNSNKVDAYVQLIHESELIDTIDGANPTKDDATAQQVRSDVKQITTQSPSLDPLLQGIAYYYLSTVDQQDSTKSKARQAFKTQGINLP